MKPHTQFPLILGSAWIAFSTLAAAQSPDMSAPQPPRDPRPPLEQAHIPTFAEPTPAARSESVRSRETSIVQAPDATPSGSVITVSSNDDRFSHLYWDTDAEGTTWVRGRQYKASFGADGATYYPLFGSAQPRHYPLQLSLASATSNGQPITLAPITGATREGDSVVIHRGTVDEVYEMTVDGIEQNFVVGERPQGDLKLFVSLQSDLPKSERTDGFEFTNEMGSVRYGQAFAHESSGTRRPLTTRGTEGGVEIDVDAGYVASAQFPLVVDPFVTTWTIDGSAFNDLHASVAYDASTDRFLYVYQEIVTATDSDVFSRMYSSTGAFVSGSYADTSIADWYYPSVANLNASHVFMVAGRVLSSGLGDVQGRQTSAASLSWGPVISIASGAAPSDRGVSIGGDPYPTAPAYFCVAFERSTGPTNSDIRARLITDAGTMVGSSEIAIDTSAGTIDRFPCVSKGDGGTQWNIVWQRGANATGSIRGAQLFWNGSSITTPSFAITSGDLAANPTVSSPLGNGDYVVAWQERVTFDIYTDFDINAAVFTGGTAHTHLDLTDTEGNPNWAADQVMPHIDTDGTRLVLAYTETWPTGQDAYMATFLLPDFNNMDPHVGLATSSVAEGADTVVSEYSTGGNGQRFAVGIEEAGYGGSDIGGFIYDAPDGGAITSLCGTGAGTTACPCGNNGATGHGCASSVNPSGGLLVGTGTAKCSGDTLVLTASGLPTTASCLYFQGTDVQAYGTDYGQPFGDGLRCVGGGVIRLVANSASAGSAIYPTGSAPHVSVLGGVPAVGAIRLYQCWYRNSGAFCTASTFNLTNAVQVVWVP